MTLRGQKQKRRGPYCQAVRLDGSVCGATAPYVFNGKSCCRVHLMAAAEGPRQRREVVNCGGGMRKLPAVKFASKKRAKVMR